jgi:uncharacterized protein YndB with AHSA1/START domain
VKGLLPNGMQISRLAFLNANPFLINKLDFSLLNSMVMVKNKFVADYQINASRKIVFQYLSTASGLEEWFAEEVRIDEDKNYIFHFDGEDHFAKLAVLRSNSHVKFDFFDPKNPVSSDQSYIEFKLEENELTQSLFLKVIDYSNDYQEDELSAIWESMIAKLKEIIGG